jgi:hypothetical protein
LSERRECEGSAEKRDFGTKWARGACAVYEGVIWSTFFFVELYE